MGLRKCASQPCLLKRDSDFGTEVFVTSRTLHEFSSKVPKRFHKLLEEFGVCHFMVIVRSPSGGLTQFDFGPAGGGDIAFGGPVQSPMAAMLGRRWQRAGRRVQAAEIREHKLARLPASHIYMGRTGLSLDDIRSFNSLQQLQYQLHRNDCRHYVDRLCQYATGVSDAAAQCKRQLFRRQRAQSRWSDPIIHLAHTLTDVASWPRVQAASQAALAMAGALTSRSTLQRLRPRLLPGLASRVITTGGGTAAPRALLLRRRQPMAVATLAGATAAYTAGTARAAWPMQQALGGLGEGLQRGARSLLAGVGGLGRSAAQGAASCVQGAQQVLSAPARGGTPLLAMAGAQVAVRDPHPAEPAARMCPGLGMPLMRLTRSRQSLLLQ